MFARKLRLFLLLHLSRIPKEDAGSARRRGREALGLQEHEIAIIYYGYLYPLKGVETLIAAFARLPANTRLLIVGETGGTTFMLEVCELSNQAGRGGPCTMDGLL